MRRPAAALPLVVALVLAGVAAAATLPGIPKPFQPYKGWHKVNAKPIPDRGGPHPGVKNVYASKRKVGAKYPVGTIVVKEGLSTSGDKRFVSLIAVMQKIRGSDPVHGDWKFTEWVRSSPTERFSVIARDATCWSCHGLAKKTDWVYTTR